MTELTIISTFMKDPGNADKPTVQIGMSYHPQEEAKRVILGPYATSVGEIDNQIDDLIRQLELARVEAKEFLVSGTP